MTCKYGFWLSKMRYPFDAEYVATGISFCREIQTNELFKKCKLKLLHGKKLPILIVPQKYGSLEEG